MNIKKTLYIFIFILLNLYVLNATSLFSVEISEAEEEQLKNYKNLTKWMLDNQDNFDNVIEDNAKATNTKWQIDEKNIEKESSNKSNNPISTDNINQNFHIVKQKDTIYSIAKQYNVSVDNLTKWNSLDSKKTLKVGNKIYLSEQNNGNNVNTNNAEPKLDSLNNKQAITEDTSDKEIDELPKYKHYKVKKGDTIYSIAKMHNMTKDELVALNDLKEPYELTLDVILKVSSNYSVSKKSPNQASSTDENVFIWPVVGRLLIPFGPQAGGVINEGINISAKQGTAIKAVQNGVVVYVGNTLENFGNIILIQHSQGWVSAYAHTDNIKVKKGDSITQGQIIAEVSNTGGVVQPQLHFELRQKVKPMDPLVYLNSYR